MRRGKGEEGGRKRCGLSLLFLVSAFILELLPYGTVLPFAVTLRRAFSYFGLTPFGYADFPPFLTALLPMLLPVPCLRLLIAGESRLCVKSDVYRRPDIRRAAGGVGSAAPFRKKEDCPRG